MYFSLKNLVFLNILLAQIFCYKTVMRPNSLLRRWRCINHFLTNCYNICLMDFVVQSLQNLSCTCGSLVRGLFDRRVLCLVTVTRVPSSDVRTASLNIDDQS